MKKLWSVLVLLIAGIVVFLLFGRGGVSASTTPLQDVERAIFAANEGDHTTASDILDITAVARDADHEVNEHWDRITSRQRVVDVSVREDEARVDHRRLFITLANANYPTHRTRFWIHWDGRRWSATTGP